MKFNSNFLRIQILKDKLEAKNDDQSFLEKLFNISIENPQFTFEDVFAETVSILAGVSSLFQENLEFF